MLFRLGIVGGVGFVLMHIALVTWYYVENFIIISFNPGLESPRFSYEYLISVGFLIGLIIKSRK